MEGGDRRRRTAPFGVFEAAIEAGELRKHGLRLKPSEQPFQILAMLLERPGEIVSREEMRELLWPRDTFVDFDHGLKTAVMKLGEVLGGCSENPRSDGTLTRPGYDIIVP